MIVVRKNISKEQGGVWLLDLYRYFFYITNDRTSTPEEIVFLANDRCHQENLIEQLKNGPRALQAPLNSLESNWAYMVMTALAWNLKAWAALRLPEAGRWKEKYRLEKSWLLGLEFKAFLHVMVMIPCQMVRQARGVVFRVLNYHPHLSTFFRLAKRFAADNPNRKSESGCSDHPRPQEPTGRKRFAKCRRPKQKHLTASRRGPGVYAR